MENKSYLEEDFDPKTLKVPQLRNLLVEYNVDYPSSAKKPELIEIFNREIKPKASQLLAKHQSVIANNSGIIEIKPGEQASFSSEEPTPKKPRTKQTARKHVHNDVVAVPEKKERKKKLKTVKPPPSSSSSSSSSSDDSDTDIEPKFNISHKKDTTLQKVAAVTITSPTTSATKKATATTPKKKTVKKDEVSSPIVPVVLSPESVIPKKRSKKSEKDSEDVKPNKKRVTKSPKSPKAAAAAAAAAARSPTKSANLDQQKFEEGPDIFNAKSPKKTTSMTTPLKQQHEPKKTKRSTAKKTEPKQEPKVEENSTLEESFASATASSTPNGSAIKFKNLVSGSPELIKKYIKSPFQSSIASLSNSNNATPKGPKKKLGFVDQVQDEEVKMKIITPSISDEEEDLKKLQDEMSIHLEQTEEEVAKVDDELETERASSVVEQAFKTLFFKLLTGLSFGAVIIMALTFSIWYMDQKLKIGFCGSEVNERTFKVKEYDQFDLEGFLQDKFSPDCSPCPPHGECDTYLQLSCDEDYMVSYPWYSMDGLLPVAPQCVPDEMRLQRIADLVNYSLGLLASQNAINCGKDSDEIAGMTEEELHNFMMERKDDSLSDEKFEELWVKALEELENDSAITIRYTRRNTGTEEETISKILRSTSRSKFGLQCQFQEIVYHQLIKFKIPIAIFTTLVLISIIGKFKYDSYIKNKSRVDHLCNVVTKKLIQQNKVSAKDNTGLTRDYLALVQLRDVLIDDSNRNKSKLWNQVVARVTKNSNVEERTIEIGGEIIKIWKWIGVDIDLDDDL